MSMFDEGVRLFSMVDIKSIETHSTSPFYVLRSANEFNSNFAVLFVAK